MLFVYLWKYEAISFELQSKWGDTLNAQFEDFGQ